ncbi:PAS domain S-box protein [Yoonia sp. GPGPB17]|uniref:ATP-binding protein n=1 Tax=Yoonia sp. GPGPB17 TaxID=3026147 RepID=UPI0030BF33E6
MIDHERDALLLYALLDAIPDAVLISDARGIITRANPAVGKLFGHDPATLIGQSVNMLMPLSLADRHDGFMQNYLETGKARIIGHGRVVEGLRWNGSAFPLHLSVGKAEHDGETQFVAVLQDLTERFAAEDALARSARVDAIGQMTGGISHDFSNILTVIIGNLELLQARLSGREDQAMVADALEAAALGSELTEGLGAFARKSGIHSDPVDVNAACDAAMTLIKRTFDPKYDITFELMDPLPVVLADTTQLQSALINIALNARDAMPDGGKLIVRSEMVSIDDTYIAQELHVTEGDYVRISVTDTGRGMGPDTQQQVFEPYFTTKPVGKGSGLGLAMVYGFVRQCGGHVTIYSEVGHGTTIALYFPIIDGPTNADHKPFETPAHHKAQGQTLLVVEDNPHVRKLTTARLRDMGYQVREAASGDVAAEILRQEQGIDAVFTDLVMPGELDGLALARHVVATYPTMRILLTSGYAEDILRRQTDDIQHQILRKPYRQSDLAKALSALFETTGASQDLTSQVKE